MSPYIHPCKKAGSDLNHQGEKAIRRQAKIGVMRPQAKGHLQSPGAERRK